MKITALFTAIFGAIFSPSAHAETYSESALDDVEIKAKLSSVIDLTNASAHDLFFRGIPPGNVMTRIQVRKRADQNWLDLARPQNPVKRSPRILKAGKSIQIAKPKELSVDREGQIRMGHYVSWNPNEKTLSLDSRRGAQPAQDGWVYFIIDKGTVSNDR